MAGLAAGQSAAADWLFLGAKHWAPAVVSKSGIGTAEARAEARVTRAEIEGWCANWSPDDKDCVRRELESEAARKTYRASADCLAGRITPVDGHTYTLAGVWDASDVGAGRTRWRDASGKIVGRDNASGGLGISQQWELLCPGPVPKSRAARSPSPPKTSVEAPAAMFAPGEIVEARYGREWVRGRVQAVRQVSGATGPELAYDVKLDTGRRGILPAHMVRKADGS